MAAVARTIATTEGEMATAVAEMAETVAEVAAVAMVTKIVLQGRNVAADTVTMGRERIVETVARGRVPVAILVLQKRRK